MKQADAIWERGRARQKKFEAYTGEDPPKWSQPQRKAPFVMLLVHRVLTRFYQLTAFGTIFTRRGTVHGVSSESASPEMEANGSP